MRLRNELDEIDLMNDALRWRLANSLRKWLTCFCFPRPSPPQFFLQGRCPDPVGVANCSFSATCFLLSPSFFKPSTFNFQLSTFNRPFFPQPSNLDWQQVFWMGEKSGELADQKLARTPGERTCGHTQELQAKEPA